MNSTNCVLIGFMGSGKSTIARELHKQSGAFAIDSDALITYNENLSITEIFTQKGEAYFRELESKFCTFAAQNFKRTIISTGGGMPIFCNVKQMGKVFFLHLDFEAIFTRLNTEEISKRPLFTNKDSAFKLYNTRLETYKNSAHYCINANQTPQNIAQEILSLL
ncbi:shikimate kinase [Helicobacter winghamensis]|uniref:shikimate kinase n=1 Tax=Helicobacter winghamensis TaxID=157268 RepID=UPI0018A4C364|nr:shikimate kinase [Helicobacter winghamensis]QOQ97925.1 AAA family ATPase [Helicobacter winghamensis]